MSNSKMIVPGKIKVGYQNRDDTYTKKLAYVVYFDSKGVLRKEKSWESWRDKKIDAQEFSNEPTSGFVLNRGGGGRGYSSWDTRNEFIRVWDPRDFEFEISVANLLFILQESSSIKGKGLDGEFVYAWDGTELVLLPVDSADYGLCTEHTARQVKKLVAKDIRAGNSYRMKNGTNVLYLGKYPYSKTDWRGFTPVGNRHIFFNLDDQSDRESSYYSPYIIDTGFTKLAESVSTEALPTFPEELDRFKSSKYYGEIVGFQLQKMEMPDYGTSIISEEKGTETIYYVMYIRHYGHYWNRNFNNADYRIKKAIFIPEVKDNKLELPSLDNVGEYPTSLEELRKFKYYKLFIQTPAGTGIEVRF